MLRRSLPRQLPEHQAYVLAQVIEQSAGRVQAGTFLLALGVLGVLLSLIICWEDLPAGIIILLLGAAVIGEGQLVSAAIRWYLRRRFVALPHEQQLEVARMLAHSPAARRLADSFLSEARPPGSREVAPAPAPGGRGDELAASEEAPDVSRAR